MSVSPVPLKSKGISLSGPVRVARRQSTSSSSHTSPMPLTARRSISPMPPTADNARVEKGKPVLTINTDVNNDAIVGSATTGKTKGPDRNHENENIANSNNEKNSTGLQFSDDVLALASPSFKSIKRRSSVLGTAARVLKTPSKESANNTAEDVRKEMELDTESRSRLSPVPMRSTGKRTALVNITSSVNASTVVNSKLSSSSPSSSPELASHSSPTMALVDRVLSSTPPPQNLNQESRSKFSDTLVVTNNKNVSLSPSSPSSSSPANTVTSAPPESRRVSLLSHPARRTSVNSNLNASREDEDTAEEDNEDENNTAFSFPISKRLSEMHRRLSTTSLGGGRRSSVGSLYDTGRYSDAADYVPPNRPWQIEDFTLGKPIGKGKFGNVYLAKQKETRFQVALKVLFKTPMIQQECVHNLKREVEIQCRLKHRNIVQLYGYFHDAKSVYLILEFITGGELYKSIGKNGGSVDQNMACKYMKDIASAIAHMHRNYVAHRDLKPENVLINEVDGHLKVADFGWAVHVPPGHSNRYTFCGTPEYIAPEMVSGSGHGIGVDLWAMGVMFYEFIVGKTPFVQKVRPAKDMDSEQLEYAARNATYENIKNHKGDLKIPKSSPNDASKKVVRWINALLSPSSDDRITASDLLTELESE